MGRKAKELSPLAVAKLTVSGMHFVGHVAGLALRISETGARSWILRIMIGSKRRDIGLGSFPEVSLAAAKEAAKAAREQVRAGIDPLAARRSAKAAMKAEQASFMDFETAVRHYMDAHEKGWKNAKHVAQWRSTIKTYASPVIGRLHVRDVALGHVLKILEPIWSTKTETASRLRGRIESVLDWAKARGLRSGDNPAAWKGNLDALLPAPAKVSKVKHHKAIEWQQCPTFIAELRKLNGKGARALEFLILTGVRSGEVREATWDEMNLSQAIWTIPASRMKAGKEHRVPLSSSALSILKSLPQGEGFVFKNDKGCAYSDMALTMILRRMNKEFTVHGFRSTFRDWAGETTSYPREVIEHALAHQLKDKAEAAYARGDLFTKRIGLMKSWTDFLNQSTQFQTDVVAIYSKKAM